MKTFRHLATTLALLIAPALTAAPITGFNDIQFWTGTGSNQASLVIDWNRGPVTQTLAWGYRWNGSASVADMFFSLVNADPALFARIDSNASGLGTAVFGLGYDANHNGTFGVSGAIDQFGEPTTVVFSNGVADMNTSGASAEPPFSSIDATASDPGDIYLEGWFDNGFWGLYFGEVSNDYPVTWSETFNPEDNSLVNNSWFAFSISDEDFGSVLPGAATAAPIPEPTTILLLGIALTVILWKTRRRTA